MRLARLGLAVALTAGGLVAGQDDRSGLVSLPVSAQAGPEAWSLQAQHLEVTCDGKPVTPTPLRRVDSPISVGIVLEPTQYMVQHVAEVQAAIRAFLGQIRPGDEVFTVNSAERPALGVGFTSDPDAVVSSLSLPETKRRPHLYDGIDFAVQYLQNARNSTRILLVLFSSDDVLSTIQAKAVRERLLSAHVQTYVISLYGRTPNYLAPTLHELTRMASESGGDIWEVLRFGSLPRVMAEVRIRPGYLLDLYPAQQCGAAETHALNLQWKTGVAHQGVALRYQHKLPGRPQ